MILFKHCCCYCCPELLQLTMERVMTMRLLMTLMQVRVKIIVCALAARRRDHQPECESVPMPEMKGQWYYWSRRSRPRVQMIQ